eukprot:SAG11_NODE_949_length_6408_cov_16.986210_8_plen_101_part_00
MRRSVCYYYLVCVCLKTSIIIISHPTGRSYPDIRQKNLRKNNFPQNQNNHENNWPLPRYCTKFSTTKFSTILNLVCYIVFAIKLRSTICSSRSYYYNLGT